MYKALYRKYRPTNFEEVCGQEVVIKSFENAINNNLLSHAYLFSGPRGTGKTSVAKIIGKTVNCLNRKGILPCNKCVNCTQFNNGETNDIIEIDAASNNGVDEIRELKSKVNLVPSSGFYKIYIIDEVHMLTTGAFNALLKTLEEPPKHVIFILATTDPHKVPSTILSRCQRFEFKKIPVLKIKSRLKEIAIKENIDVDDEALEEISRLSDGGLRDAISLFDQSIAYSNEKITIEDIHEMNGTISQKDLKEIICSILDKDILSVLNKFDSYNEKGKNLVKLTEEILLFLRNLLILKTVPNYFENKEDIKEIYESLKSKIEIDELLKIINEFNETINKMRISNNPKLIFELAIIKLTRLQKTTTNEILPLNQEKKQPINIEETNKLKPITTEKLYIKNEKLLEKLKLLKKIRINNTLACFQKKELLLLRNNFEEFRSYILDSIYNEIASAIVDGNIKAASDESLILVFKNECLANLCNENLILVEELFEKIYQKKYKVISLSEEEWTPIRDSFNHKTKKFELMEENLDIYKELNKGKNKDSIEEVFSDIIEYE